MKKITIAMGVNEARLTMMVPKDKVSKIFKDMVNYIIDNGGTVTSVKEEVVTEEIDTEEVETKEVEQTSIFKNILVIEEKDAFNKAKELEAERLNNSAKIRATQENVRKALDNAPGISANYKPYADDRKFLIYYNCNSCHGAFFTMKSLNDRCSCSCGSSVELHDAEPVMYKCPCCQYRAVFKLAKGSELTSIKCKGCESPIDMKYNDKRRRWENL